MKETFPSTEVGFHSWQAVLVALVLTNATSWGIPTEDVTALQALQKAWADAYAITSNRSNRTSADVTTKNEAKKAYQSALRKFIQIWLAVNPKIDNADRTRMNIAIPNKPRTPIPVPQTAPIAIIDFSMRLQHSISFYDTEAAHSNAKPYGVTGCQIFIKKGGEAPKSFDEMRYLETCTASPALIQFQKEDAGLTAWYWLRWINTKGETGPWSLPENAIIVG